MNSLHLNGTAYGTLPAIVDPADGITAVTPTSLSALVIKNGTDTGDSVTITAVGGGRTGVYKWSYDPAGEVEGDQFSIVFTITVDALDVYHSVDLVVKAVERGTDGANTTEPLDDVGVRTALGMASDNLDSQLAALPADIESALVDDGDATALLQAIADKIASDLTAGDLTAQSIVSAIKSDATLAQMIARVDDTISSRSEFDPTTETVTTDEASRTASKNTKAEIRDALDGRWTDETGAQFDLTVTDTP